MRYFLWGSIQDSSEQSSLTHCSSESATHLLHLSIAGRVPIPLPQIPLQTLTLPSTPNFHSCINSTPVSLSETRQHSPPLRRAPNHCHPDRSSGAVCRCAVEGPRQPISPFTIRRVQRRPRFSRHFLSSPPIHFSYPSHSFFLLWKFLFPFDAAFPLAL